MKNILTINVVVILSLLTTSPPSMAQGPFVNLDFEAANVSAYGAGPTSVPIAKGLPGWTGYTGTNQVNQVVYNTVSLGAAAVSLQGTNGFIVPLQGLFSAGLQSSDPGSQFVAAIAQTGQVPQNAISVTFFYAAQFGTIQLSFAGQAIPLVNIGAGTGYDILGGDISAFAGQTGELRFSSGIGPFGHGGGGFLDNILFSTQAIPEPSCVVLFGVGGLLLGFFRRRNSS